MEPIKSDIYFLYVQLKEIANSRNELYKKIDENQKKYLQGTSVDSSLIHTVFEEFENLEQRRSLAYEALHEKAVLCFFHVSNGSEDSIWPTVSSVLFPNQENLEKEFIELISYVESIPDHPSLLSLDQLIRKKNSVTDSVLKQKFEKEIQKIACDQLNQNPKTKKILEDLINLIPDNKKEFLNFLKQYGIHSSLVSNEIEYD